MYQIDAYMQKRNYCCIKFQLKCEGLWTVVILTNVDCATDIYLLDVSFFNLLINYSVELNWYFTTATTFYFMNFFSYVKHLPKIWPLKKPQVKVKSRSKVISAFVFYLWLHLWQTVRIAANFLHNSLLSKNTRFSRCAKFSFSQ